MIPCKRIFSFPQRSDKMPFPEDPVGHQPERPLQMERFHILPFRLPAKPGPFRPSGHKARSAFPLLQIKIRMFQEKPGQRPLIFLRRKRTGRVHQPSAGLEHDCSGSEDILLPGRARADQLRTPLGQSLLLFAEHPLAGAGSIHRDLVKKFRKPLRKLFRRMIGYHHISQAHPLHILGQNPGPGRMNLVGEQKPPPLQPGCNMACLPPGRRTEVKDKIPGLRVKKRSRGHGAWLLDIVDPCLVERAASGAAVLPIKVSFRSPGNRPQGESGQPAQQLGFPCRA